MSPDDLAPWMDAAPDALGLRFATLAPRVRVVIEVDAADAPWLVRELHRVGASEGLAGQTSILAACTRARTETP